MPIYEYKCLDCGVRLEKRQSVSEEPLSLCDACGGRLEKQWSLSGFQFKGAGWYVTDYAGNKPATGESSSKSAEKTSSGESTSSTDTASNTKTDTAPAAPNGSAAKTDS